MPDFANSDVGLVRFPIGQACKARILPAERDVFVAALPIGHSLARRRRLTLADLSEEAFVMYCVTAVPGMHAAALLACQQAGFIPNVQQEAVQVQTLISLVESGMGVALVTSVTARQATRNVVLKTLVGSGSQTAIGIAPALPPGGQTAAALRFRDSVLEEPAR